MLVRTRLNSYLIVYFNSSIKIYRQTSPTEISLFLSKGSKPLGFQSFCGKARL